MASPHGAPVPGVYHDIRAALRQTGVTLSACLPDDWVSPLVDLLDRDPGLTNVRVAREPEIIGICSGAFFAGVKSVGIMGATGFLTCLSEICTLNLRHQIPLLLLISLRGTPDDPQVFQEVQGRVVIPLLHALGLPSLMLDTREKIARLPEFFRHTRVQKRPGVVCLPKSLIQEGFPA